MRLTVVVPVFNDWTSFRILVREIDRECASTDRRVSILALDDGSTEAAPETLHELGCLAHLTSIEHIKLALNVGHQRAIAIGLAVALEDQATDALLVMDADGEDRPSDIHHLMAAAVGRDDFAIVAQRGRRTEKLSFKLSYLLYKSFFGLLTGKKINFGNYSLISREYAQRLSMSTDLWNNLPAALMRSRLPIIYLPLDRGKRYSGKSKMNYVSLIVHGLSAISVFSDAIFVRLLIATAFLSMIGLAVILTVVSLRLFTVHATPGWATTVVFGTAIILSQVMFTTLISVLLLLNSRSQKLIIPAMDYKLFISRRRLFPYTACQ